MVVLEIFAICDAPQVVVEKKLVGR